MNTFTLGTLGIALALFLYSCNEKTTTSVSSDTTKAEMILSKSVDSVLSINNNSSGFLECITNDTLLLKVSNQLMYGRMKFDDKFIVITDTVLNKHNRKQIDTTKTFQMKNEYVIYYVTKQEKVFLQKAFLSDSSLIKSIDKDVLGLLKTYSTALIDSVLICDTEQTTKLFLFFKRNKLSEIKYKGYLD